jgi:hypothetical protein
MYGFEGVVDLPDASPDGMMAYYMGEKENYFAAQGV